MPEELRRRLDPWLGEAEIDPDAFWRWVAYVLPLLPKPTGELEPTPPPELAPGRMRELARDLVDCAQERTRLHVACQHYYEDNRVLASRVKGLEAALRTFEAARALPAPTSSDPRAAEAAGRYLPRA